MPSRVDTTGAVAKIERPSMDAQEGQLQSWLRENIEGCAGCRIVTRQASAAGGLSSETFVVELSESALERVVVKKDVRQNTTNPQANFATAVQIHAALGEVPGMRVPRLLGVERVGDVLGSPFMVMEYEAGEIPADVPSYAAQGWVHDATDAQRGTMWQSGVDFLVKLHAFEWRHHKLAGLQFDAPGDDPLERCLNWSVRLFRDQAQGRTADVCERAIEWLRSRIPSPASVCLNWGDARIGNIIWRDYRCHAVIDWEMATIGHPGIDLGWWSFFHRWSTYGQGLPALGGVCEGQALADLYESRGGSHIEHFRYYEVLAAIRGVSIWLRLFDAMKTQGAFAELSPLGDTIHIVRVLELLMRDVDRPFASREPDHVRP